MNQVLKIMMTEVKGIAIFFLVMEIRNHFRVGLHQILTMPNYLKGSIMQIVRALSTNILIQDNHLPLKPVVMFRADLVDCKICLTVDNQLILDLRHHQRHR